MNAATWQKNITSTLKKGAVLTIDYGIKRQVGERNRVAVWNFGRGVDSINILDSYKHLGEVDITSNIDFEVLENIAIENGLEIAFSDIQLVFLAVNDFGKEIKRLLNTQPRREFLRLFRVRS